MEEWVILAKGRIIGRFTISEGQCLTFGRDKTADVVINNSSVSRQQSSLELKDGIYYLADLHSLNGTKVNGKRISSAVPIKKSAKIEVGKFILKPAENLMDEKESTSVASPAMDDEAFSKTIYVSGIYHQSQLNPSLAAGKGRKLIVLTGKASPAVVRVKGKESIRVGKDPKSDLVLSGPFLGTTQFSILIRKEGYFIVEGAGFHRKTKVNGKRIKADQKLNPADIIQAGTVKIKFE